MKKYIILILVINLLNCFSEKAVRYEKIIFPYQLIDYNGMEVKECLDKINTNKCESLSWELAFIGDYYKTLELWNVTNKKVYSPKQERQMDFTDYELKPAKEILLAKMKDERVVMFNEGHHLPHHRMTTMEYLDEMYEMGYSYLGVEGLKEEGKSLMDRRKPTINSGYYLKEPQYSNLIKKAILLGYKVFNYDIGGQGKERELNQVAKISEILKEDKDAKIVIHAGWGHIREDTVILGGLMANEFYKKTGINPLTINQTRFNEQSEKDYEHWLYQDLEPFDEPSLLINKRDHSTYTDSITDIILLHPRTRKINNRPDYLKKSRLFSSQVINYKKNKNERLLILMYDKLDEIPIAERTVIDIAIKEKGMSKVELYLPFEGEFIIYGINSKGEIRDIQEIKK